MKKHGAKMLFYAGTAACFLSTNMLAGQRMVFADYETSASAVYQTNTVVLSGSEHARILGGSFRITDYKITQGQDPEERNFIGKQFSLSNGEIQFQAGRSGSKEVADWFNRQVSGYNAFEINGDRTTFDQTAEELNFAFKGDLTLQVQNEEGKATVVFPEVFFAQGNTFFRNNWWFAQEQGQHTKDADGENTVLVFGRTSDGRKVAASFLRGNNGVNTVSLEGLMQLEEADEDAVKLPNVLGAFQKLPASGTKHVLAGSPGTYDPSVNHVQGHTIYGLNGRALSVLTHSVASAEYAHILAGDRTGMTGFKTYLKEWKHPGGIQRIGDYLLVPTEHEAEGHVSLYDLRTLKIGELRRAEQFDLHTGHKAGALGITRYRDRSGTEYFLMIVAHLNNENSVYHCYRANAADGLEHAKFKEVGSFPLEKDFQGFGLITEEGTEDIYMIGLWSPQEGASFADYAFVYRLDKENWSAGEVLAEKHFISRGGAPGMLGVHFRYGSSAFVTKEKKLVLTATERNSYFGSQVAMNTWISP